MKTWQDFGIVFPITAPGPEVYTTCPQCSPHRKKQNVKCLSVNIEKEVWVCHHCDWRGALKTGVEDKGRPHQWKPQYKKPDFRCTDLPQKVVDWFAGRGIKEEILKRNKISYDDVYMPQIEDFTKAIRFPFYRDGEVINVKSRDGKKNFRMESGAERIFYGLDDMAEVTVIVEGEVDKLSCEMAGYLNCVSVPDGAPSPKAKDYSSKFEFLENCQVQLEKVKSFILAVDADEPGQVLQEELARRLGKERCKIVVWPYGCKDANEILQHHGVEVLRQCLLNAKNYPIEGVFEFSHIKGHILDLYDNGAKSGIPAGWKSVNDLYSVRPGEWTLVTGIPGHGKSEWLDALMVNIMWKEWRFAIFSPENQPLQLHAAKLMEKTIGKPFHPGPTKRMTREEVAEATDLMNNCFTFVLPPDDEITIDGVLTRAKALVFQKGIRGLVIDPWNELDHQRPNGLTETEYISQSLTKIRRFARANDIHIWVVVHPTKLQKDKNTGIYPVPTPYDCQGSAHWRNKADNCIAIYRNDETGLVEVHVQKIRFKEVGKVGLAELRYDRVTGRYTDASDCSNSDDGPFR